jgi:hypothetical protein
MTQFMAPDDNFENERFSRGRTGSHEVTIISRGRADDQRFGSNRSNQPNEPYQQALLLTAKVAYFWTPTFTFRAKLLSDPANLRQLAQFFPINRVDIHKRKLVVIWWMSVKMEVHHHCAPPQIKTHEGKEVS